MAKIPIRVYEELDILLKDKPLQLVAQSSLKYDIEWIDNNGINTPYIVTVINNE